MIEKLKKKSSQNRLFYWLEFWWKKGKPIPFCSTLFFRKAKPLFTGFLTIELQMYKPHKKSQIEAAAASK